MQRSDALSPAAPHERSAPGMGPERGPVADFVARALGFDPDAIERDLERMRRRHRGESDIQLARRCVTNAGWHAAAVSLALGLPEHPALVLPAAAVEALAVQRIRLLALARVALLQEARVLESGRDPVAALREGAGRHAAAHAAAALWSRARKRARRSATRRWVEVDAARLVGALCERIGLEACSRKILMLVPVVGAVAGALATASALRREMECAFPDLAATGRLGGAVSGVHASPERTSHGVARRAAVEILAAGFRTCDVLVAAMRRSRAAVSALLVDARAADAGRAHAAA